MQNFWWTLIFGEILYFSNPTETFDSNEASIEALNDILKNLAGIIVSHAADHTRFFNLIIKANVTPVLYSEFVQPYVGYRSSNF